MIRMNRGTIMIMTTITSMNMVTDIIMSMTTTTATTIIMSMTTTTAMTIITITTTTTAMTIIMITITVLIIMNMIIMVIRTRILECMRSSISYGICICRKRWKGMSWRYIGLSRKRKARFTVCRSRKFISTR